MPFVVCNTLPSDITVRVSWDWKTSDRLHTEPLGRDQLLIYYRQGSYYYCQLDGGDRGAVAQTKYSPDFSSVTCTVNTLDFSVPQDSLRQILRMLPIRQILLSRGVLFLHASQVLYKNKGILFSAPSGTGKTTQAKLWQQHRKAEILCNDRTLLRKNHDRWMTYGYPYDGSEPVGSVQSHMLGCIVLLRQAGENKIERLSPAKAIARLMRQTVIDGWDPVSRCAAMELIAAAYESVPIYALSCTVSEQAVTVLESALQEEGIFYG